MKIEEINSLIEQISNIIDIRHKQSKIPGNDFNIFLLMNMESDEVDLHCRLIYGLLRPDGNHGMGDKFLRSFFEIVLDKPFPEDSNVIVSREYKFDEHNDIDYGRIDLLIEGKNFCYPIEVKIYAEDQERQVERYYDFIKRLNKEDCEVYYLTLTGYAPSARSLGSIDETDIKCLSFAEDIRKWIIECSQLAWNIPSITETTKQYIKLIDKLTGKYEDEYMENIQKIVGKTKENYESAVAIADALNYARAEKMKQIFHAIESNMNFYIENDISIEKINSDDVSDYDKAADIYYASNRNKGLPGISYHIGTVNGIKIILRFEIDWRLYAEIIFFDDKKQIDCPKEFINDSWNDYNRTNGFTITDTGSWKYLLDKNANYNNFRTPDPILFDPNGFEEVTKEIAANIDNLHIKDLIDIFSR